MFRATGAIQSRLPPLSRSKSPSCGLARAVPCYGARANRYDWLQSVALLINCGSPSARRRQAAKWRKGPHAETLPDHGCSVTGPDLSPIPDAAWFTAGPRPADQAPPAGLPEPAIDAGWAGRAILAHLAGHAARQPRAIAIADGAQSLDFAALYASACRLGAALRTADWPEGAVGVLLPNDARYLVAMFGCLAAGRPCMLLDPHQPGAMLSAGIAAAGLVGLLATPALAARLDGAVPVLDPEAAAAVPPADPVLLDPAASVFIVSTSGSTGVPKAVVQIQQTILANYAQRIRQLRLGPQDRVAVIGPPATAGAVSHRLYALMAGAGLVLPDPQALGLGGVLEQVRQAAATVLHATPRLVTVLAGLPAARAAFAGLRLVMLGGDALLQADLALIRAALPAGCRVSYGLSLSEAARVATWFVPEDDRHDPVRVGSGYLNQGVEVAILDEAGHPAAPGEAGELVVRTPFAAAGDWVAGRMVETRFPTDPAHPGKRVYRTGDIGRLAPDGVLVVLGRRDRMVKIAGQRVEPATIEMALRGLPGIADAAVVARQVAGEMRLAGFVVPAPDAAAMADTVLLHGVRAALRGTLPAAMIPASLHRIGAIPLTGAGKRDDAALAALVGP